jgi:hypothetical protein
MVKRGRLREVSDMPYPFGAVLSVGLCIGGFDRKVNNANGTRKRTKILKIF